MKRLVLFLIFMFVTAVVLGQSIRLFDGDSDGTNDSFTHAVQTSSSVSFTGYYWGFGLNSNAAGVCTLCTYYNDVSDQTDTTGFLLYPGGGVDWFTYQPVSIDSFYIDKACSTDVLTWMISGR